MDNSRFADQLRRGCEALGVGVGEDVPERLYRLMGELLKWNAKVNLTAITAPEEVLEKHFLDSLAVLPEVEGAASVLDVGAGAGFPGLPLKMARGALSVTMVDAVGKKVGYLKAVVTVPGLGLGGTKAVHTRAEGRPEAEGLPRADRVLARAFMDLPDWLDRRRRTGAWGARGGDAGQGARGGGVAGGGGEAGTGAGVREGLPVAVLASGAAGGGVQEAGE
ncbi:16S rRNA (guanine(527)-N(7))-methyltransferase RsmG [Cystobacter fuscus]